MWYIQCTINNPHFMKCVTNYFLAWQAWRNKSTKKAYMHNQNYLRTRLSVVNSVERAPPPYATSL